VTVRDVVRYPAAVLKAPAGPAGPLTDDLRALAEDLIDTMRAGPATVGLAAPQIGEPVRAFALDVAGHPKATTSNGLVILFDPQIVTSEGEATAREGCLSVPDLTADVRRATTIEVTGLDREGRRPVLVMEGFEARAAQHELDHLDGLLILDRVGSASSLFPRRVYL
jgi:peptide deformylase